MAETKNTQKKMPWRQPPTYMNPLPKQMPESTEGRCPHCHKHVKSLELHIHDKHLGEKPVKRR